MSGVGEGLKLRWGGSQTNIGGSQNKRCLKLLNRHVIAQRVLATILVLPHAKDNHLYKVSIEKGFS